MTDETTDIDPAAVYAALRALYPPSHVGEMVGRGSPLLSALKQAQEAVAGASGGRPDPIEQRIADAWRLSCNAPQPDVAYWSQNSIRRIPIYSATMRSDVPPAAENCCPHCGQAAGTKTIALFTGTAEVCAGCGQ